MRMVCGMCRSHSYTPMRVSTRKSWMNMEFKAGAIAACLADKCRRCAFARAPAPATPET